MHLHGGHGCRGRGTLCQAGRPAGLPVLLGHSLKSQRFSNFARLIPSPSHRPSHWPPAVPQGRQEGADQDHQRPVGAHLPVQHQGRQRCGAHRQAGEGCSSPREGFLQLMCSLSWMLRQGSAGWRPSPASACLSLCYCWTRAVVACTAAEHAALVSSPTGPDPRQHDPGRHGSRPHVNAQRQPAPRVGTVAFCEAGSACVCAPEWHLLESRSGWMTGVGPLRAEPAA